MNFHHYYTVLKTLTYEQAKRKSIGCPENVDVQKNRIVFRGNKNYEIRRSGEAGYDKKDVQRNKIETVKISHPR